MKDTLISKTMTEAECLQVLMQGRNEIQRPALEGLVSCYRLQGKTPFESLLKILETLVRR